MPAKTKLKWELGATRMRRLVFIDDDRTELEAFRDIVQGDYHYTTVHWPDESAKLFSGPVLRKNSIRPFTPVSSFRPDSRTALLKIVVAQEAPVIVGFQPVVEVTLADIPRQSWSADSTLPFPEQLESPAMPANQGLRPHDHQRLLPIEEP
jgi:hypothetical protein